MGKTSESKDNPPPTPPTRLVLVRHAVTSETGSVLTGRAPGVHLSERGREQAGATAERLAAAEVSAVYSSPIERTTETAEIIAGRHGLPVTPLEDVTESDLGEWTGETLSGLAKLDEWKVVQRVPSRFRFPGGESFVEMQSRTVRALDGVAADHPGGTAVVVSHADPIRAALAHYSGAPIDMLQRFIVNPASVSVVALAPWGACIVRINDTGDLTDLDPAAESGGSPDDREGTSVGKEDPS